MTKIDFSKMEGHTPGPWEAMNGGGDRVLILSSHLYCGAVAETYRHAGGDEPKAHWANTALIAAAPAMKEEILRQLAVIDGLVEAAQGLRDAQLNLISHTSVSITFRPDTAFKAEKNRLSEAVYHAGLKLDAAIKKAGGE